MSAHDRLVRRVAHIWPSVSLVLLRIISSHALHSSGAWIFFRRAKAGCHHAQKPRQRYRTDDHELTLFTPFTSILPTPGHWLAKLTVPPSSDRSLTQQIWTLVVLGKPFRRHSPSPPRPFRPFAASRSGDGSDKSASFTQDFHESSAKHDPFASHLFCTDQ